MNYREAMRIRRSVRTFLGQKIQDDLQDQILKVFEQSRRLNDLHLRMEIKDGKTVEHCMTGVIGSYGAIRNAPVWAIGISKNGENHQENLGFAMEQFILECTRQNIGTCWVGGFFKKSLLNEEMKIKDDEKIVCITPVGYAAARRLGEKAMRAVGGLNRRKPVSERFFLNRWGNPADEFLNGKPDLKEIVELTRWAPSASNLQPCHYVLADERKIIISVLTSLQKKYPGFIANDRAEDLNFQGVDAGIGMAHIDLAASEFEKRGKWNLDIDRNVIMDKYGFPPDARIIGEYEFGA